MRLGSHWDCVDNTGSEMVLGDAHLGFAQPLIGPVRVGESSLAPLPAIASIVLSYQLLSH